MPESEYYYIQVLLSMPKPDAVEGEWIFPFQDIGPGFDNYQAAENWLVEIQKLYPGLDFILVDDNGDYVR